MESPARHCKKSTGREALPKPRQTLRTPAGRRALRPPLPRAFYDRGAERVAADLLGCVLVHRRNGQILAGRIVETEAYVGESDRACHAHRGKTARNAVMYGEPAHAYVYFIYGMYDMLNVVCGPAGVPEAVLLRALEPVHGLDVMRRSRGVRRDRDLANGPGKLCRALGVTRALNGAGLLGNELWIAPGTRRPNERLARSTRIGVDYAGPDALRPWRYYLEGNPNVSRHPGLGPRGTG